MSETKKSYLYLADDGGLALDVAGFLRDPVVRERVEKLRVITRREIAKNRRAGKSKAEGVQRLRIPDCYRRK